MDKNVLNFLLYKTVIVGLDFAFYMYAFYLNIGFLKSSKMNEPSIYTGT